MNAALLRIGVTVPVPSEAIACFFFWLCPLSARYEVEVPRAEAERLLAELKAERVEAEAQVRGMLAAAEEQARAYEADAKVRLEESLARRQLLAERKIANAEAQAEAEVRAAAVDLATHMAETVLADRLAGAKSDPLVDRAIPLIAEKLA